MKTLKLFAFLLTLLLVASHFTSCASKEVQTIEDPDEGSNNKYKD